MRKLCVCWLVFSVFVLVFSSCAAGQANPLSYQKEPFSAEVHGVLNGTDFAAVVSGLGEDGVCGVSYLSPDALSGISFSIGRDGVSATVGGRTIPVPREAVEGLLLPIVGLTSLSQPETVTKKGDEYRLTFSEDRELTVGADGIPRTYRSPALWLEITAFRQA